MLTVLACYPPTRRHAVVPAGGQQHACVEPLEVRCSAPCTATRCPCAWWSTSGHRRMHNRSGGVVATSASVGALLLSHLPPLSLVGHSSSAHYPLPVTMVSALRRVSAVVAVPGGGLTLEVNRGYAIPYYISRARAGRLPTAGLEKKRGPDRAISGSSEHLISLLSLKGPNMPHFGPLFVPFLHPIIVGMWRTCTWCACPHVSPSKGGLAVALRPFRLFTP